MKLSEADIIIVPGQDELSENHWQSRWLAKLPSARLVESGCLSNLDDWAARIVTACTAARLPVVLVAHASGITAVMHVAKQRPNTPIAGAFLVAAHDPEIGNITQDQPPAAADNTDQNRQEPSPAAGSLPVDKLPFPSMLVASNNCPNCKPERAKFLAEAWGSVLVEAGDVGQLNAASGHGPWPEGLMRFGAFLKTLG